MHSVTLCSNKQAITSFTQFVYTTLTEYTYSLVANYLIPFIMKATNILSVTWNYLNKPNCILIEYTDGSSLMLPNGLDEETEILIDGIINRWQIVNKYDIF